MPVHYLKTWPEYFEAIKKGIKTFEVRLNDRNFLPGDELCLRKYLPEKRQYEPDCIWVNVLYVLEGPEFGIGEGVCCNVY